MKPVVVILVGREDWEARIGEVVVRGKEREEVEELARALAEGLAGMGMGEGAGRERAAVRSSE